MTLYESFRKNASEVHFVDRRKSWLMWTIHYSLKVLSWIIGIFGAEPLAGGDFMGNYVTTIGKKIYAHPKWNDKRTPKRVDVHELCHVLQNSWRHRFLYVFSPKYRLLAESEAYQAAVLCFYKSFDDEHDDLLRRAKRLEAYMLNRSEAYSALYDRLVEIEEGNPMKNAATMHEIYKSSEV